MTLEGALKNIIILGIAGGTGSGKTTLADRIVERFGDDIAVIHHDNYYRAHYDMTYEERAGLNYDHPDSFETELMIEDIKRLRSGEVVHCPVYDYTIHNRTSGAITVEPKPIILVEGILIFENRALCDLMDMKIFVDTDADTRLIRRIRRDTQKRDRTLESILTQYTKTVKPMHDIYVEPSKRKADVIVREGGMNDVAFDMIVSRLKNHLTDYYGD